MAASGQWAAGPYAATAPNAYPGGYQQPGYPGQAGYPPQSDYLQAGYAGQPGYGGQPVPGGYPAAPVYQVPGAYPGQGGYAAAAGYPAPGDYPGQGGYPAQAAYPPGAYPDYVPQAAAYVTLDEQDDTVNGGSYAYVIREEQQSPAPAASQQPQPQPQQRPQGQPPQLPQQAQAAPRGPAARQGPAARPPASEESQDDRGAFEPPAGLLHIDYDLLADDSADSLERLKDLYDTAEALGGEGIDRHFNELLERQRKLISAYFTEYRTATQAGTR
jgi:hypothetical protein